MKVWHPVSSAVGMVESLRSRSSTVLLTIYLRPCIYALAFRVNHLPDSTLLPHVLLPADTESHCSTCRDTYLNCNCISSCVGGAGCVPMCTGFPVTLHPIESIAGWGGAPWPVCGSQKTDSCQGLALTSHLLRQALPRFCSRLDGERLHSSPGSASHLPGQCWIKALAGYHASFLT